MSLIDSLKTAGVLLDGHFKLKSGRHARYYINKDSIYCKPHLMQQVVSQMVQLIEDDEIDIITGPAIAGAVLAVPIAMYLGRIFVYPEKVDGEQVYRRGYDQVVRGKKVAIVEDVITTGSSVVSTVRAIKQNGGTVNKCIAIWNRSGDERIIPGITTWALIEEKVESWLPIHCPLCKEGVSLLDPKSL